MPMKWKAFNKLLLFAKWFDFSPNTRSVRSHSKRPAIWQKGVSRIFRPHTHTPSAPALMCVWLLCASARHNVHFGLLFFGSLVCSPLVVPHRIRMQRARHQHRRRRSRTAGEYRSFSLLWWRKLDKDSHSFTFICLFRFGLLFSRPRSRVNCCTASLFAYVLFAELYDCRSVGRLVRHFICLRIQFRFASCQFQLRLQLITKFGERWKRTREMELVHINSQLECDFDLRITCYDIHMQLVGRFMHVY